MTYDGMHEFEYWLTVHHEYFGMCDMILIHAYARSNECGGLIWLGEPIKPEVYASIVCEA